MKCNTCNAVQHAYNMGRAARLKGQSMLPERYPGMTALNGAFNNGYMDEENALRTGDDSHMLDDDVNVTSFNVQEMRDNLDWAREF